MLRRVLFVLPLAAFAIAGAPVIGQESGLSRHTAEAAPKKVKVVKRKGQTKKYTYQYYPAPSGRTGGWR